MSLRSSVVQSHLHSSNDRDRPWEAQRLEREKRRLLQQNHNPKAQERQKSEGKLLARERVYQLVDSKSFAEFGTLVRPNNLVAGIGRIGGETVVVAADDFTSRGSHADGGPWAKQVYAEELALSLRVPMLRLLDGASGGGSVKLVLDAGFTYVPPLVGFATMGRMLGEVPVVALLLGPVVGLGAAKSQLAHYTVMSRAVAQLFTAGPPVVKDVLKQTLTKEELGGAAIVAESGSVDEVVDTEADCYESARRFLSFLPQNVWTLSSNIDSYYDCIDPSTRREEELNRIIPKDPRVAYDIRRVITLIVDVGSFFEIGQCWGKETVCGFARLTGYSVGILSQDCVSHGGSLTALASQTMRRFVDLCSTFHVPTVSLVDQPGFAIGSEAERVATIRHGTSAIVSLYQSRVPWFTVILRRCYGVGGAALVDHSMPHMRVAWPSGDWGSLPVGAGVDAAFRSQDRAVVEERIRELTSPLLTAEKFSIEEIIEPWDTRPLLCRWVQNAYTKLRHGDSLGPQKYTYRP